MTEVSKEEAEAEADNLRLDIKILPDKLYDLERTNALDKLLGLETSPIQRRWYRDKKPVGSGAYGVVFRECWKQKGSNVEKEARVVKIIDKEKIRPKRHGRTNIEGWKPELRALVHFSQLQYQDAGLFVYFHGWYDDLSSVTLVMEWIPLGNLERWVQKTAEGRLPEKDVVEIAAQMFRGLRDMHDAHFAHRDLKPENILVERGSPNWWIKLADFGFSKEVTKQTILQTKGGTEGYMAPEVSHDDEPDDIGSSQYSHLVDIWSAGCVIFRLLSGGVPEDDKNSKKFHSDIPQFLREKLGKLAITEECFDALEGMLQRNASKRLTAESALRTAWLIDGAASEAPSRPRRGTCLTRSIRVAERERAIETVKSYIAGRQTSTVQLLHEAACQGELQVVRSLLELGVDANTAIFDSEPRTALASLAGTIGRNVGIWREIMELLCEGGCDVNALPESSTGPAVTALFAASSAGFMDRVQWLLDRGAGPSLQIPCRGLFPLHVASQGVSIRHYEVVLILLEREVVIDAPAKHPLKPTALHLAVEYGRVEIIKRLLAAGAKINRTTAFTHRTPLHIAVVGMGSAESNPAIKQAGRLVRGQTPGDVPAATSDASLAAMRVLLEPEWNAELHATDSEGMTPLHYAARYLLNDLAIVLISAAERRGAIGDLRLECKSQSAYTMAWEAAKAGKQEFTIANRLEGNHTTAEERGMRKKATTTNIFKRLLPKRDKPSGSDGRWSSTRSSFQGNWDERP